MSNFELFRHIDPKLSDAASKAEEHYAREDYNACLVKTRQIGEFLADMLCDRHNLYLMDASFNTALGVLSDQVGLPHWVMGIFRNIQQHGNRAAHSLRGDPRAAGEVLHQTFRLMLWSLGELAPHATDIKMPKFRLPEPLGEDSALLAKLRAEQESLANELAKSEQARRAYEQQVEKLRRPNVTISDSFTRRFATLPEEEREALTPFVLKFREDPEAFTFQKLNMTADDKFAWVGLDDDFWGLITVTSPGKDVIVCVWIGEREECELWSSDHRVDVHPQLGSLQLYSVALEPPEEQPSSALFAKFSDEELISCGVPPLLIPAVRVIEDEDALLSLVEHLPGEASDALVELATGKSVAAAREVAGLETPDEDVDTQDFDLALGNELTRRHIVEVDDEALEAILKEPLSQWRIFLHPSQKRAVEVNSSGPVRVLGGAGTGKTVALIHRAVLLVRERLEPEERVLVTTYTRNLALELAASIRKLTTDEEFARIDIRHIHKVARDLLAGQGISPDIASDRQREAAWDRALEEVPAGITYPRAFYEDEWRNVIVPHDIQSASEYMKASRRGRGTSVHKLKRAQIWPVFQAYRDALNKESLMEWDDLIVEARELVMQQPELCQWRALLSDEVQDYKAGELRFLRALVPRDDDDMFLVGDGHQRIYGLPTSFKACGVHIVGRSFRLKVNYRTTERIRDLAMRALAGEDWDDMNEGQDDLTGYHSIRVGEEPVIELHETFKEEYQSLIEHVRTWLFDEDVPAQDICIAARFSKLRDTYQKVLENEGYPTVIIDADSSDEELGAGIRLATFHRLKGMEFSHIILAGVQEGVVPYDLPDEKFADDVARHEHMKTERALFYVAATRARDHLVVMGVGDASPLLGLDEP